MSGEKSKAYWEGWRAGMWSKPEDWGNPDYPKNPYLPYAPQYKEFQEGYSDGLYSWDMEMDDGG